MKPLGVRRGLEWVSGALWKIAWSINGLRQTLADETVEASEFTHEIVAVQSESAR